MQATLVILLLFSAVLSVHTAPTKKPDVAFAWELADELENLQTRLSSLSNEFKKILEKIHKEPREKSEKREMYQHNTQRAKKKDDNVENRNFISRIAHTITKKLSTDVSPEYLQHLVNSTANHLVARMNASHGVDEFHRKLLVAVKQILNERSEKYETPVNKSLPAGPKDVDQSKVVQGLEELLEGPLISGFVSQKQIRKMIRSAITALSKDFGLSKSTTEDIVHAMITHVQEDVKAFSKSANSNVKTTTPPMTNEEKILGLENMLEDKVKENNLNLPEMKYLVKGLVNAVGARNNLSEEKTKKLEEKIFKEVREYFAKSKIPENYPSKGPSLLNDKNVPKGFLEAQQASESTEITKKNIIDTEKKDERRSKVTEHKKDDKEDDKEDDFLEQLKELEKKLVHKKEKANSSDADNKWLAGAGRQKQYLKKILSNSFALIESLDAELKKYAKNKHENESEKAESTKSPTAPLTKSVIRRPHSTESPKAPGTKSPQSTKSPKAPHTKSPKAPATKAPATKAPQSTNSPTAAPHTTSAKTRHTEPQKATTRSQRENVTASKNWEKFLPDNIEKEIEKAEVKIQQEIEKQSEKQKKMKERFNKEKEKEKKKESGKQKVSEKKSMKFDKFEKEIEKELEKQGLKIRLTTTRKPKTSKNGKTKFDENELMKELDDLF